MKEIVTYQIGDTVQAYDGRIGIVVYTHQKTGSAFGDEQQVWMKCPNGSVIDASAACFRTVGANRMEVLTKDKAPTQSLK
jgi:hypothetical protein